MRALLTATFVAAAVAAGAAGPRPSAEQSCMAENARLQLQVQELTARIKTLERLSNGTIPLEPAEQSMPPLLAPSPHRAMQEGSTAKSCTSETLDVACTVTGEMEPFASMPPGNHRTIRCLEDCEHDALGLLQGDINSHVVGGGGDAGRYDAASPVCLAAMHSTSTRTGGSQFIITIREAQEEFVGESREDLLSLDYGLGAWRSFSIEADPCTGFVDICAGEEITRPRGTIGTGAGDTSAYYENDQNCAAIIVAPRGQTIVLTFLRFDVELQNDKVLVFDGPNATHQIGPVPEGYSGFEVPADAIRSSGNKMKIQFVSDGSVTWTGWEASWEFQGEAIDADQTIVDGDSDVGVVVTSWSRADSDEGSYVCPWTPETIMDDFLLQDSLRANSHSGSPTFEVILPFAFPFFEQVKPQGSTAIVACGGYISFSASDRTLESLSPHSLPSTSSPNDVIAVFWTELEGANDCTIYTELSDDANEFIIEWHTTV
eukprot:COSAG06_NODE_1300_length_9944_cov_248.353784_1_plen_487_part_10